MSTGDKVIFPLLNQRVDKKDLNDMQVLLQETVGRTLASLLGEGGGALTTIPFTWDDVTDIVTFGPFMMAYSSPQDTGTNVNLLDGGVVIHDPTRAGQNGYSTVNLSGIGALGYLWFKRYATEADFDNRAYWPGPGTGEQVIGTNTREREYVRFAVTDSLDDATYNNSTGWWRFGTFQKVTLLGTTTLLIYPISAFGDDRGTGANGVVQLMGSAASTATGSTPTRKWGLNRLAQDVISNIIQMKDSDVTFDPTTRAVTANPNGTAWRDAPTQGLRQVADSISLLQASIDTLNDTVTTLTETVSNSFRTVFYTPQVLGFVYVTVDTDGVGNKFFRATPNYGPTGSLGDQTGVESFLVEVLYPYDRACELKFTITSPYAIDSIATVAGLLPSVDIDKHTVDESATRGRSLLFTDTAFPKTYSSAPTAADYGSVAPSPTLADGQFISRAMVVRYDLSTNKFFAEYEPFTLVVYGRNLTLGA